MSAKGLQLQDHELHICFNLDLESNVNTTHQILNHF